MSGAVYDAIGDSYNTNRTADKRVLKTTFDLLGLPAGNLVADVGAGTGNYANALASFNYRVIAVEPSEIMRKQAVPQHGVTWVSGCAEALPLKNASINGVIIILAIHHFSNIGSAAKEVSRICPAGPLVILTMDPRESEKFWFNDYFPGIAQHVLSHFPPLSEVISTFSICGSRPVKIAGFPLPHDFADKNMCAGWNRPELYLEPMFRQNTSGFALASPGAVQQGLNLLEKDLESGKWDRLNGHLRERESFDAGFRFLLFRS